MGSAGAPGAAGPAGPPGATGAEGPPGPAGAPAQTDFANFAHSSLGDPEYVVPRDINGLDFWMTENPSEFDALF
jgi:hypothetical protein